MNAVFLLVWFYLYVGLMFATMSYPVGLFRKFHWTAQVAFWPVFLIIQAVRSIRESDFGWFVRYSVFKLRNPEV